MQEDKIKINVTVSGRIYPLRVTPSEEEYVRQAVDFIEKKINAIEEKYAIKDVQDVQAILLIELASELNYLKRKQQEDNDLIDSKLEQLNQLTEIEH